MKYAFIILFLYVYLKSCVTTAQNVNFQKTYNFNAMDWGTAVDTAHGSGYVVCGGSYEENFGWGDALLVRFNVNGDTLWKTIVGDGYWQRVYSIRATPDFGYVVTGNSWSDDGQEGTQTDVLSIKFDSTGTVVWQKTFGGSGWDASFSIKTVPQGGFIIVGATESFGPSPTPGQRNIYLLRLDAQGDTLWTRAFGTNNWDEGHEISLTQDGGFIVCGTVTNSTDGTRDMYLLKLDVNGQMEWERSFGVGGWEEGRYVATTDDGGYILSGFCNAVDDGNGEVASSDFFMVRTNVSGDTLWTKITTGIGKQMLHAGKQTQDGAFVFAGEGKFSGAQNNTATVIKLDESGQIVWNKQIDTGENSLFYDLQLGKSKEVLLAGWSYNPVAGSSSLLFVSLEDLLSTNVTIAPDLNPLTLYPSPTTGQFFLTGVPGKKEVEIFNTQGQLILSGSYGSSIEPISYSFHEGLFFVKVISVLGTYSGKVLILK